MKTLIRAIGFFFILTIIVGGIYPAMIYGVSQVLFKQQANGGMITHKEQLVGAELIGQEFTSDKYFWSRPSAAGYNATASTGSNYALTNADHQKAVKERQAKGLDYDLLTTSASGLDPHISPKAAHLQIARVAQAQNISPEELIKLVDSQVEERQWGFLGEQRVNVLKLNLELQKRSHE